MRHGPEPMATGHKLQAASNKQPKAASRKRQASSTKRRQIQATSIKRQATSVLRLESVLNKCQDTSTWKQFAGALTGLLGKYKSIVRMLYVKTYLVWTEANFIIGCYLQLYSKKVPKSIVPQQIRSTKNASVFNPCPRYFRCNSFKLMP